MVKVVLTGSIGHISKPLAELLLRSGHSVSVISSSPDRRSEVESLGAESLVGSIEDPAFLSTSFAGADVVYIMVPPKYSEPDNTAYYRRVADSAVKGITSAGVKKVVLLSSFGAHLSSGTGFIVGSYHTEQILGAVEGISLTIIRPGYFYYNLINFFKGMIQQAGFLGANYGGKDRIDLTHPLDIAEAIAEEVQALVGSTVGPSTTTGTGAANEVKVRYVISDQRSADEIAAVLGAALHKPDLKWVLFTDEQAVQGIVQSGKPAAAAAQAAELGAALHSGALSSHYDSLPEAEKKLGKVKLEQYVRDEFVPAFNA